MDFDADGKKDIISGSWPGQLYLFRGLGKGKFAKSTLIKDKSGEPIKLGSASTVFACDFQGNGKLDLLVGDIRGKVHLVVNEGTRKAPVYGKAVPVKANGRPIYVPGDSHPTFVDWNGNGKPGLLIGAANGSVRWFPNVGSRKNPKFGNGVVLLSGVDYRAVRKKKDPQRGSRTKICVVDWNRDGKLDLLVGDYSSKRDTSKMTPVDKKKLAKLQAEMAKLTKKIQPYYNELREKLAPERKKLFAAKTPEARAKALEEYRARSQEIAKKYEKVKARRTELYRQMRPLTGGTYVRHGYVWLYLRQSSPTIAK